MKQIDMNNAAFLDLYTEWCKACKLPKTTETFLLWEEYSKPRLSLWQRFRYWRGM
jgi:hypothetical protein